MWFPISTSYCKPRYILLQHKLNWHLSQCCFSAPEKTSTIRMMITNVPVASMLCWNSSITHLVIVSAELCLHMSSCQPSDSGQVSEMQSSTATCLQHGHACTPLSTVKLLACCHDGKADRYACTKQCVCVSTILFGATEGLQISMMALL